MRLWVVEYVPQYDEETTPVPYQKPERLVPVQPVANPAPKAGESRDEVDDSMNSPSQSLLHHLSRLESYSHWASWLRNQNGSDSIFKRLILWGGHITR